MKKPSLHKQHGFSLTELATVVAIIGLIVGGIIAGRAMIRTTELKSVMHEARVYQTAMMHFMESYHAIPGDMANAEEIWGSFSGTCGTDSLKKVKTTCNGDGNHKAEYPATQEPYIAWQHLRLAGLIDASYTGATGPNGAMDMEPGENVPKSELGNNAGWGFFHAGTSDDNYALFDGEYGHVYMFGGNTNANEPLANPILTPGEMLNVDTKFDDGKAAKGIIVATHGAFPYTPNCTRIGDTTPTASTDLDADYNEAQENNACILIYRNILE